jgi:KUP system potassium uptake protein
LLPHSECAEPRSGVVRGAGERRAADYTVYFLSRINIERGPDTGLPAWQQRLFIGLSQNAASPAAYFRLPVDRTVVVGTRIQL